MKLLRLAAFAALVSLAACTASPTGAIDPSLGGRATMSEAETLSDGGGGIGSGNYSDDGLMDEGTPVPADTTARGPGMIGSGN